MALRFDGITIDPERDVARLGTALEQVRESMADGRWWTLAQLSRRCGTSECSASARIRDLRKLRNGGRTVESKRIAAGLWAYRLHPDGAPQ